MLSRVRCEVINVARELIVQEGFGVLARTFEQGQINERRHDRRFAGAGQFDGWITEIRYPSVIDSCAACNEILLPVRVHHFRVRFGSTFCPRRSIDSQKAACV